MNVLVIGSGGREHALVWKLSQSSKVNKIYCVPGNGGIAKLATCVNINILDFGELIQFVKKNNIELTLVGPELPLVAGIVNAFEKEGLAIFGPTAQAAELEGSKTFAKEFMEKYNIPTAKYAAFSYANEAKNYINRIGAPCVVKADGLASGKGVIVAKTKEDALCAVEDIMVDKAFGNAGNQVVIEEFLEGIEISVIAISDGKNVIPMLPAQDHKRIFDGDRGPNTGGMGAYAPAPICDHNMLKYIQQKILEPTVIGMAKEGRTFKGVLYAGLMITKDGPKVLEYNVRFGDPETQPIMLLLESDLVGLCQAVISGNVNNEILKWKQGNAVCVVAASSGYPGSFEKDKVIEIEDIPEHTMIFHAGTKLDESDRLLTSGGRVLGVTSIGENIEEAIQNAYSSIEKVKFDGMYYRKDIGLKALL